MEKTRCGICYTVSECQQIQIASNQAHVKYVFACTDYMECVQRWLVRADNVQTSRLLTFLAEYETHEDIKAGPCAECKDMVYKQEDRFTYNGGRANLHMQCFITKLTSNMWSSANAIADN